MYIEKLKLHNFKNYTEAELEFSPKINCFFGKNAAGKTNLLDAIYYLSFCKSYFNPIDSQNIQHDKDVFAIHATYDRKESHDKISCVVQKMQRKIMKMNDKEYNRLSDHIGKVPLVIVSPSDSDIIYSGSDERRKFIDSMIAQIDYDYLQDLIAYNRALKQRNMQLKKAAETRNFDPYSLQIWDEALVKYGIEVHKKRKKYSKGLLPFFERYYQRISDGNEKFDFTYESQLTKNDLAKLLQENIEKDKILKYTSVGIHKDDFIIQVNDYPIRRFGSQGQQKSFLIALKLAQYDLIREEKGYKPLLLLDDIFDKLDEKRIENILALVSEENFKQIFITDTQKDRIVEIFKKIPIEKKIFEIENGKIAISTT
jgi:DNA replication and repair protein RecF